MGLSLDSRENICSFRAVMRTCHRSLNRGINASLPISLRCPPIWYGRSWNGPSSSWDEAATSGHAGWNSNATGTMGGSMLARWASGNPARPGRSGGTGLAKREDFGHLSCSPTAPSSHAASSRNDRGRTREASAGDANLPERPEPRPLHTGARCFDIMSPNHCGRRRFAFWVRIRLDRDAGLIRITRSKVTDQSLD